MAKDVFSKIEISEIEYQIQLIFNKGFTNKKVAESEGFQVFGNIKKAIDQAIKRSKVDNIIIQNLYLINIML